MILRLSTVVCQLIESPMVTCMCHIIKYSRMQKMNIVLVLFSIIHSLGVNANTGIDHLKASDGSNSEEASEKP